MWVNRTGRVTGLAGASPSRPGFTLLEIILVVGLLALLAAMAWPLMETHMRASALPDSAERLRAALVMARCDAMMLNRKVRVRFAPLEQHPYFEFEIDPLNQPEVYEPLIQDWADERLMLDQVQVFQVLPGKPVYLEPVAAESELQLAEVKDAAAAQQAQTQAPSTARRAADALGNPAAAAGDTAIDSARPPIVFEPDGSTQWATIVLAAGSPEEPMIEDAPQKWIVLDGRTGLPSVREPVTQEQLDDPTFYVQREKLEPPAPPGLEDGSMLTIQTPTPPPAPPPGSQGPQNAPTRQGRSSSLTGGTSGLGAALGAAPSQLGQSQNPGAHQPDRGQKQPGHPEVDNAKNSDELEEALANSDLTEAEKAQIRKNFKKNMMDGGK
jgi:prepilin-type N-terminal cleavage/methylation domain-containing protein